MSSALGPLNACATARFLQDAALPPPDGIRAAAILLEVVPEAQRPELVHALWEARPAPESWQFVFYNAWVRDSRLVVVAARRDRARLREWFDYAALPGEGALNRALRPVERAYLPGEMVAYRGGRRDPCDLAAGLSWTPDRAFAARFADQGHSSVPPMVVRRVVRREQAAVAWLTGSREVVVLEPGPWEIDTADPAEIAALAAGWQG